MGTELGTMMCHNCLVRDESGENRSISLEEDGMVMVAGSNPEGTL